MKSAEELLANDHKDLDGLLNSVWSAINDRDSAEVFRSLDLFWARLAMHIKAENLHLFPCVINKTRRKKLTYLSPGEVQKAIERLTADHNFFMQQLSQAIRILRGTDIAPDEWQPIREIIANVNERLVTHNGLEEAIIYRLPAKLLSPDEQIELVARIEKELEKLPPRYL